MNWTALFLLILYAEGVLFIVLMIALLLQRSYAEWKKKKQKSDERAISQVIIGCLQGKQEIDWREKLKVYRGTYELTKVLETFSRRFSGQDWKDLQEAITASLLLPEARKNWKSRSWFKRNLSARCFLLCPLMSDKDILVSLADDPIFLVRSKAAAALLNLEVKEGVEKVVTAMSIEKGYASDYFYDLILQNETPKISNWIQEFAMENRGAPFHLACLELLAGKMQTLTYPNLNEDLASEDPEIRLAAIRVFTRNPQKGSEEIIYQCMVDPDDHVREEGYTGAMYFLSKKTLENLQKGLSDRTWTVRRAAAFSLKKMGKAGIEILQKQTNENKEAFAISQYALQFDEYFLCLRK